MRRLPLPGFLPVPLASWAPDGKPLSLVERLVLAVVVERWRRGEDEVRVTVAEVVRDTGLAERSVRSARARLVRRGLLVLVHRGGSGRGDAATITLGPVVIGKGASDAPIRPVKGCTADPLSGPERVHGKGAPDAAPKIRKREGARDERVAPVASVEYDDAGFPIPLRVIGGGR